jgi:transcriptional regulator with XRE-family HTH domain
METWADKIAALEDRGWSLTAIARAIGIPNPSSLSDIKQGRSKEPRGMAAVRLHNLFSTGVLPPPRLTKTQEQAA